MFFLTIGILLAIISIIAINKNEKYYRIFWVMMLLLFLISSLRYSMGSDYFAYAYIFERIPFNIQEINLVDVHGEIGFKISVFLIKSLGFSYEIFLALYALFSLILFGNVIKKHSRNPIFSLFIFFAMYYSVYINSGIRQGLAMALLFFAVEEFYMRNKNIFFIIIIIIASLLHTSAIIFLLIFITNWIRPLITKNISSTLIIIGVLVVGAFIFSTLDINSTVITVILGQNRYGSYFGEGVSWLALLNKLLCLLMTTFLFFYKKNRKIEEEILFTIYFLGVALYLFFVNTPMISRLSDYFIMFEIILIPNLAMNITKIMNKFTLTGVFIILYLFLLVKDLNSFTIQEKYYNTNALEYQYITLLDKSKSFEYKMPHRLLQFLPDKYY